MTRRTTAPEHDGFNKPTRECFQKGEQKDRVQKDDGGRHVGGLNGLKLHRITRSAPASWTRNVPPPPNRRKRPSLASSAEVGRLNGRTSAGASGYMSSAKASGVSSPRVALGENRELRRVEGSSTEIPLWCGSIRASVPR